jgi:hypothetical protein
MMSGGGLPRGIPDLGRHIAPAPLSRPGGDLPSGYRGLTAATACGPPGRGAEGREPAHAGADDYEESGGRTP